MSTKLSKDDVKAPDQVLKTLNQGFQWSQNHSRALIVAVMIFVVVGVGYSLYANIAESKENKAQEAYFPFEKSYLDKKRNFEEADRTPAKPLGKDAKDQPAPKAKATGDLDKDYGTEVTGLNQVIDAYPDSKAAQMAALTLSEAYLNYKRVEDANLVVQKVEPKSHGKDLISSVVLAQYGNILAEKGDCKAAVDQWAKVLENSKAAFMHDTLRIKSAFCYEKMNDTAKAEELYKKVTQNSQDPKNPQAGEVGLGKEAEKYLRLLKLKKNAG